MCTAVSYFHVGSIALQLQSIFCNPRELMSSKSVVSKHMVCEGLQGNTRVGLLSVLLNRNIFTPIAFTYRVLLISSCIYLYFPYWFLKMTIMISHNHFAYVAFASILVFQTFDRMIFVSFPGTRWCGATARVVWGDSTGGVGRQHGTHNWCHEIRRSLGTTDASEPTEIHTLHFTCFT